MIKELQYQFFSAQNIKPAGWVKEQLRLQADGLAGNLDRIWPDVRDSAWIGGECEGWERVPYWLDGFIPLAYLLEDENLILRAKKYINAILDAQAADGWICPCPTEKRRDYDTWAVFLILKVLTVYADCSGDERIPGAVERCLKNLDAHLNIHTLRNWGAARWFECLIPIFWLYGRTQEKWLITLAQKLKFQGFDWKGIFDSGFLDSCTEGWEHFSHVVNIAMMLKSEALMSLLTGGSPDEFAKKALEYLEVKHGTAAGHFNGDENLSGLSPVNGTELCGVVEAMYSYEWLFAITGDTGWLDRLEKLAYNALPAAISPDMWSHQYDQMTNQAAAFPMSRQPFRTNGNEAHLFGLEPNFGCCTANFGQGWPKFVLTAFMKTKDGIASCALTPSEVNTEIHGVPVKCGLATGYPFRDTLIYQVETARPVEFVLSVRIPVFAGEAEMNGKPVECGKFVKINRVWNGCERIEIKLKFQTNILPRPNDMVCVWRGPLLYSVAIDEKWEKVEYIRDGVERKYPYCDYYIYPESKWNYALTDDKFAVKENSFVSGYGNAEPPVEMTAKMAEIEWGFHNGHCDGEPISRIPSGEVTDVRLIPYGCTNLRMTEVPYVKVSGS